MTYPRAALAAFTLFMAGTFVTSGAATTYSPLIKTEKDAIQVAHAFYSSEEKYLERYPADPLNDEAYWQKNFTAVNAHGTWVVGSNAKLGLPFGNQGVQMWFDGQDGRFFGINFCAKTGCPNPSGPVAYVLSRKE